MIPSSQLPSVIRLASLAAAVLLAAALGAGCRPSTPTPGATVPTGEHPLAVAFWNLDWFPGQRPHAKPAAQQAHVAAVVPVADQIDPDILGLEEIAGRDAAAAVVAHLRGFKVDVCSEFLRGPEQKRERSVRRVKDGDEPGPGDPAPPPAADEDAPWTLPDQQEIALCSRLPTLATGWEPWKPDGAGRRQRRGFVYAVYRGAPGEVFLVYGLHLKSNVLDEPGGQPTNVLLREEASRQLLAHERATASTWARTDRLRLVIVGGDLNTSLDDPKFEGETTLRDWLGAGGFRWGWESVPSLRRLTLPAKGRYPATCFDHVIYQSGDGSVRLVSATVENTGPAASDHHPIVARFAW